MGNGTSIGRVRGLGSSHNGTHHWLVQRYTAIGNLVLVVWFGVSLLMLPNLNYESVVEWLVRPLPATGLGLLVVTSIWHARLGVQVMVEDYVHESANKFAVMAVLNLLAFAGAAFGLFSVVRLALGAH